MISGHGRPPRALPRLEMSYSFYGNEIDDTTSESGPGAAFTGQRAYASRGFTSRGIASPPGREPVSRPGSWLPRYHLSLWSA